MTVFLDTVGLLALWDESDQWHEAAQQCFTQFQSSITDLVTTELILFECGNAAARRPYRLAVSRLKKELELNERLIVPTRKDLAEAWLAYERSENGSAGIVDQTSIVVMRRLGLVKAFTNDRHFKAAGFEILF